MPITLALDTGHARCQCALLLASGEILAVAEDRARGHAEVLIGQIESLLSRAGIGYASLQRVAATTGPASFTGLRVGLAAAQGIGLACAIPALGVGTLVALSLAGEKGRPLTVLMDAKRGDAWRQKFSAPGQALTQPEKLPLEIARTEIAPGEHVLGPALFVPIEAFARYAARLDPASHPAEPDYLRGPDAKPQTARLARQ
jgi:tRNA threonylcarbamoyl adenosine modification protein YeaZ